MEIIASMVKQLLKGANEEQIYKDYGPAYVDHGIGVYPMSASGVPFSAATLQVTADPIADMTENLAAEQKARATYEYLLDMASDPDVIEPLRFLREREIVHFQRFGEPIHTNLRRFYHTKSAWTVPSKHIRYIIFFGLILVTDY